MAFQATLLVLLPWLLVAALAYALVPLLVHRGEGGRFVAEPGWTRATATACVVALPLYSFAADWISVPLWPVRGTWVALSVAGAVLPISVGLSLAVRRGVLWRALAAAVPLAALAHVATHLEPGIGVTGDIVAILLLPLAGLLAGFAAGPRPARLLATAMLAGPLGVLVGADLLRADALVGDHPLIVFGGGGLHDLVTLVFLLPASIDALRVRRGEGRRVPSPSDVPAARRDADPSFRVRIFAHAIDLTAAGLLFVMWWSIDVAWGLGGDRRVSVWLLLHAPFVSPWVWETILGRTLGHAALGLHVAHAVTGIHQAPVQAWCRGLFRYLDVLLLYGPLWSSGRRIGDLAADTRVVSALPRGTTGNHVHRAAPER